ITRYYEQKRARPVDPFHAKLLINLKDLNKFVKPFFPDFHISKNIKMEAELSQDSVVDFLAYARIDSIHFKGRKLGGNAVDLSISKNYFDKAVLGSLFVQSKNQTWEPNYETKDCHAEFIWNREHIDVWTHIDQMDLTNTFEANSSIDFKPDHTEIRMLPSKIILLGEQWIW